MNTELIASIVQLGRQIQQAVEAAKINQAQCAQLAKRVDIILHTLKNVDTLSMHRFEPALVRLQQTLQQALRFIQVFSSRKWYQRVLNHGNDREYFTAFNTQLRNSIGDLSLALNIQQLFNQEADRQDQETDRQTLIARQEEIAKRERESLKALHQLRDDVQQQKQVLGQQYASIRHQLAQLTQARRPSPPINKHLIVNFFDITFETFLAQGRLGQVYRGQWQAQPVTIKRIAQGDASTSTRAQFLREANIMSRLRSPYIAQFYGASIEPGRLCLLTEYFPRGTLALLMKDTTLPPDACHQLIQEVTKGLHYLHHKSIAHHDLRPDTVCIDSGGRAKLTDFGFSNAATHSIATVDERSQAIAWMAPELLTPGARADIASDIFSLGMLMWCVLSGRLPFAQEMDETALRKRILAGEREQLNEAIPTPYHSLIKACWQTAPHKRPDAMACIEQLQAIDIRDLHVVMSQTAFKQGAYYEKQQELSKAFRAYLVAAQAGHRRAQTCTGTCYLLGKGVSQNKQQAHDWFLDAAQQGHPRAQYNLAKMLEYGDGIPKNLVNAMHWYHQAAQQGHNKAKQCHQRLSSSPQVVGLFGRRVPQQHASNISSKSAPQPG